MDGTNVDSGNFYENTDVSAMNEDVFSGQLGDQEAVQESVQVNPDIENADKQIGELAEKAKGVLGNEENPITGEFDLGAMFEKEEMTYTPEDFNQITETFKGLNINKEGAEKLLALHKQEGLKAFELGKKQAEYERLQSKIQAEEKVVQELGTDASSYINSANSVLRIIEAGIKDGDRYVLEPTKGFRMAVANSDLTSNKDFIMGLSKFAKYIGNDTFKGTPGKENNTAPAKKSFYDKTDFAAIKNS